MGKYPSLIEEGTSRRETQINSRVSLARTFFRYFYFLNFTNKSKKYSRFSFRLSFVSRPFLIFFFFSPRASFNLSRNSILQSTLCITMRCFKTHSFQFRLRRRRKGKTLTSQWADFSSSAFERTPKKFTFQFLFNNRFAANRISQISTHDSDQWPNEISLV